MNFLRRRFSSSDIQGDLTREAQEQSANFLNTLKKGASPSAPNSPNRASGGLTRGLFSSTKTYYNKDKHKCLLVVDDPHTDWTKYFRGRKIFGDWDIRVEQAEFCEINLAAYSESGCMIDLRMMRNGTKVVKSFKPDFVLVRQHVRDSNHDFRNIILGLQYGGVSSVNSLHAIYNFLDKPWVYGHLTEVRRRLGADTCRFPLISQCFYAKHDGMVSPNFAHLLEIERRFGRDKFPLIDQSFYPKHTEMVSGFMMFILAVPVMFTTSMYSPLPIC